MMCMFLTFLPWPLGRADPECMLGHLLKILFKNDDFMNAVRMNYNLYKIRGNFFSSKLHSEFLKNNVLNILPFSAGQQLCDDKQRVFPQCSSLSPASGHYAWVGDSSGLSRKGTLPFFSEHCNFLSNNALLFYSQYPTVFVELCICYSVLQYINIFDWLYHLLHFILALII